MNLERRCTIPQHCAARVLGHLDRQPWEDFKSFTPQVEVEEINFGTYYICRGTKLSSLDS
jgi:hypothetical protein